MTERPASPCPVPWWVLAAALGLALWNLVARAAAVWPFDVHLRDDAYYYFVWARNLAAGAGPCVTDGVPTSGVHLLWALVLAVVALFTGALPAVSVGLGLALHLLAGWVVYRSCGGRDGALAAAAYLGSPFLAVEAMNGQETALACLATALLCRRDVRSPARYFGLGLLAVAARSDLVFLVLALAIPDGRRLGAVAAIVACSAAWNFVLGGSAVQHSAMPMPWLMEQTYAADPELGASAVRAMWGSVAVGHPFRISSTPLALAWLVVAVLGWRRRERRFALLLLGGLALVLVHCFWRLYPRDYYFAPLGVVGALAAAQLRAWHPRIGLLVFGLALVWNVWHVPDPAPGYGGQREMTMAGRFAARFVPAGRPLGCFNSGIVTWEHDGRVVNLDGVVNPGAFQALRDGRLLGYLQDQGVHWVVDNPIQFEAAGVHANGRFFGEGFRAAADLAEVARFVWPGDPDREARRAGTGWFALYRVRGGGPPPALPPPGVEDLGPAPLGRYVLWSARAGQRLRSGDRPLLAADRDLAYVVFVQHRGGPLRMFLDGAAAPVLEIAPR